MLVAGIDFETTSVDAETCDVTEVAVVLWDPERNKILEMISQLAFVSKVENSHITGIDDEMTTEYGWKIQDIRSMLVARMSDADYFMAHNVAFDRTVLNRIAPINKPWIDTMTDVPYPKHLKTRSLPYLAVEHGFMNPFSHRALFDVITMIKIASMYDFKVILEWANSPTIWIQAVVNFDNKQRAKDRYYIWDPVNKFWVKQIKELNLEYEEDHDDFPVDFLPGYNYKEQYP